MSTNAQVYAEGGEAYRSRLIGDSNRLFRTSDCRLEMLHFFRNSKGQAEGRNHASICRRRNL